MASDDTKDDASGRRAFLLAASGTVGAIGAGLLARSFVHTLAPTSQKKDRIITVDISTLKENTRITVLWQEQPVWIVRRSAATVAALASLDTRLKDPFSKDKDQQPENVLAHPEWRSLRPDISVLIGLCTHLGCVPIMQAEMTPQPYDQDWKGGYICPCHFSRFDMAGRVFKQGPALYNLAVPEYYYRDDHTLVIGALAQSSNTNDTSPHAS